MKKIYIFAVLSFIILPGISFASSQAVPNMDVTAREFAPNIKVMVATTGADGSFIFNNLEAGSYEVFMNGEQTSLGKFNIKNGTISGKIAVDVEGDAPVVPPAPTAPAPSASIAPTVPAPAPTISTGNTAMQFDVQNWQNNSSADHLAQLIQVLKKENILPTISALSATDPASIKNYVKKFQAKYGIPKTGNIGPMTAKKLNALLNAN